MNLGVLTNTRMVRTPKLSKGKNSDLCFFTLADNYRLPNGEYGVRFIDCVIFGDKACNFVETVTKGTKINVYGILSNHEIEYINKKGMESKINKVILTVSRFEFCESKFYEPLKPNSSVEVDEQTIDSPYDVEMEILE